MTQELFQEWVEYFIERMEKAGYGRKHARNVILLIDGHNSRWTWLALQLLVKHGFFPFCIGSHTSAWHQPNDDGANAMMKAILGRTIHEWRISNPFNVMDRAAFNRCLATTVIRMKGRLASELAAWTAKKESWIRACEDARDLTCPPLQGKPGNVVTRAWARCGWFPLKRLSDNWKRVIPSLGSRYSEKKEKKEVEEHKMLDGVGPNVQIRALAWEGYQNNFLDMAKSLQAEHNRRVKRRHASVVDTRTGKGFTCEQDLEFLKEWEEGKKKDAQVSCLSFLFLAH